MFNVFLTLKSFTVFNSSLNEAFVNPDTAGQTQTRATSYIRLSFPRSTCFSKQRFIQNSSNIPVHGAGSILSIYCMIYLSILLINISEIRVKYFFSNSSGSMWHASFYRWRQTSSVRMYVSKTWVSSTVTRWNDQKHTRD